MSLVLNARFLCVRPSLLDLGPAEKNGFNICFAVLLVLDSMFGTQMFVVFEHMFLVSGPGVLHFAPKHFILEPRPQLTTHMLEQKPKQVPELKLLLGERLRRAKRS